MGKRLKSQVLLCFLFVFASSFVVGATEEEVFALVPLSYAGKQSDYDWLGQAVCMKLPDYLVLPGEARFIDSGRIESEKVRRKVTFNASTQDYRAVSVARDLEATVLLWGEYQISGRYIRAEIHLLLNSVGPEHVFRLTEKIDHWNRLLERISEEVWRARGETVPASLRRRWKSLPVLNEQYRYRVESQAEELTPQQRMDSLRQYLAANPDDLEGHLQLADWVYAASPEQAVSVYRKILTWAQDSGLAHASLGFLLASEGRDSEAEQHYRAALRCEDQYPEGYFNYGNLLVREHRVDSAIRIYKKGIERFPNAGFLHYNLALAYDEKGFGQLGAESYKRAAGLDSTLREDFFENRFRLDDRWIEGAK